MLRRRRLLPVALLLGAAGFLASCGSGGTSDGGLESCYLGDKAAAPEAVILTRLPNGTFVEVAENGPITLQEPPQGGKVVFVGVRARHVSCILQLTASFIDEASGRVGGTEERPVILKPRGDGYGEPDQPAELSNYSNLPACPNGNFRLQQDMFGRAYRLEVRIVDRLGKTLTLHRRVVPECGEPERLEQCRCECGACFSIDRGCARPVDGGSADGGLLCEVIDGGAAPRDGGP